MKSIFLLLLISCSFTFSQYEERDTLLAHGEETDTLFANVSSPVFSLGLSGGTTFIDPEMINSQIEFNNSVFDAAERPIRNPLQAAVWVAFRPKNLPNYLSLRAEIISSSRTFPFVTNGTNNSGGTTSQLSGTSMLRYNVYPISLNTGSVIPKTRIKGEIGFVYAVATFTDETEIDQQGSYENTYEGTGYGFRIMAQQVIPIDRSYSITIDFAYRYLIMDEFRDPRGHAITNFEANYNGIILMMGFSYGL
ncbi:MAG: hypothetical protein HYV29_06955 [Ignavibacteriales bacterium]|nr:hypothetical protein [Ignavibacteriales bacterium]